MPVICPRVDSDEFKKYWAKVNKGDRLPNGAVMAGWTGDDGVLYVGMSNKFEPGKYNVDSGEPGGKIHNLWTHAGGGHGSGYVLVCPDEKKVVWQSYKKGDKLEQYPNAFRATPDGQPGFCSQGSIEPGPWADEDWPRFDKDDGVLYIGREGPNGSIGKINLDGDRIHNLWIQKINRLDGGQILTFENSTAEVQAIAAQMPPGV